MPNAQKIAQLSQASDPASAIRSAVGNLDGIEIMWRYILVGTFFRPEKTAGGIYRPQVNLNEDQYQSKTGLVLKMGPGCFKEEDGVSFYGQSVAVDDWVTYRVGDGWPVTIKGTPCRMLLDGNIKMKVQDPEAVF